MNKEVAPASAAKELARQEQLLPFLLNPNSYPHRPRRVRLVQTHASFVFLVPPFVYKVKKAVKPSHGALRRFLACRASSPREG